jgi:hypothetical protein
MPKTKHPFPQAIFLTITSFIYHFIQVPISQPSTNLSSSNYITIIKYIIFHGLGQLGRICPIPLLGNSISRSRRITYVDTYTFYLKKINSE